MDFHRARTLGLHQLKDQLKKEEITKMAVGIYWYFELYDEFIVLQNEKTEILNGKRYKRIKYGNEKFFNEGREFYKDKNGNLADWEKCYKYTMS